MISTEHVSILEGLQRRAAVESRRHLVATVEYAFAAAGITPEMAERLIPRVASAQQVVSDASAEERVDCEKPIRDENGKFLGCEPGEGDGSGGDGERDHEARAAEKLRRQQAEVDRHHASGDKSELAKQILYRRASAIEGDEDPDEAERKYRRMMPSPDDSPRVARLKTKQEEDRKYGMGNETLHQEQVDEAHAIDKAIADGLVTEPKTASPHDVIAKRKEALGQAADDLHARHTEAERAMAALYNLTAGDDENEKFSIDPDELALRDASDSLAEHAGKSLSHEALAYDDAEPPSFDDEVPDPPEEPNKDDYDDEGEYDDAMKDYKEEEESHVASLKEHAEAKKEYEAARKEYDGKVREKAEAAASALEDAHEQQLAAIAQMKEQKKVSGKALRAIKKSAGDSEDLVSPELRAAAEKAQDDLDDEGKEMSDDEIAAAEEIVAKHDRAKDIAESIIGEHEEAVAEVSDEGALDDSIATLTEKAKETKATAARLRKALGQKPKATKPKAAKAPKKAKAAAEEDDEEDDDPEDEE